MVLYAKYRPLKNAFHVEQQWESNYNCFVGVPDLISHSPLPAEMWKSLFV